MADSPNHLRVVLKFGLPRDGGWTEEFYRAGTDIDATAINATKNLVQKRLLALAPQAYIGGYRISSVENRRKSRPFIVRAGSGSPGGVRDLAGVGVRVPVYTSDQHFRSLFVGGTPDTYNSWDAQGNPLSPMYDGLVAYLNYVTAGGDSWAIRAYSTYAGDPALINLSGVAVAPGLVTFTGTVPGLTANKKILISGFRGFHCSQFNATWRVQSVQGSSIVCSTKRLIDSNYDVVTFGQVRVLDPGFYTYPIMSSYDPDGVRGAHRNIGRDPNEHRGKRSAVK